MVISLAYISYTFGADTTSDMGIFLGLSSPHYGGVVKNNLTDEAIYGDRQGASSTLVSNYQYNDASSIFVDPDNGDVERQPQKSHQPLVDPLSQRELEVLALIADGLTNQQIADQLYIGISTVKKHINHIYSKLGVKNRTQALLKARELKIL